MSLSQFFSILRARWRSGAVVFVATVAAAIVLSLVLPKKYTAVAAMVVDVRTPDPVQGLVPVMLTIPNYMATQVDILQSPRVSRRVVQKLRLTENALLQEQWREATDGKGDPEAWIAERLQLNLQIKTTRESNVINVSYKSQDAKFSAVMANAFVDAYIDTNRAMRVDPATVNNTFFDERARQLRAELEAAQARLSSYQREKGITANDERLDVETARLNELSSQLVAVQAISAESNSREAQSRGRTDQTSDVLNNPLVAGLKADLSRQEAKLQELGARLGDAHPQVVELKASIAETRQRVETEIRRVGSSVGINANINRSREGEIRAALDAQRVKVLKLKSERDELSVQQRDVENAQRAYDAVLNRVTQTGIEKESDLTNVSLLSRAEEPTKHSSPNLLLNTALSVFLGGLLAVGLAMLRELLDRRVRSAEDLVKVLDLPVIGTMPRPTRRTLFGGHRRALPPSMVGQLPGGTPRAG